MSVARCAPTLGNLRDEIDRLEAVAHGIHIVANHEDAEMLDQETLPDLLLLPHQMTLNLRTMAEAAVAAEPEVDLARRR